MLKTLFRHCFVFFVTGIDEFLRMKLHKTKLLQMHYPRKVANLECLFDLTSRLAIELTPLKYCIIIPKLIRGVLPVLPISDDIV